ncbi:MAG: mechanosensitive ion channel [Deltaproteobacteria bacterium]|nr:mechanosensitive ion channel [Deltaproteobacteria bacterium]
MDERRGWLDELQHWMDFELFHLGSVKLTVGRVLMALLVVIATFIVSSIARKLARRAFQLRGVQDVGTVGLVTNLLHYLVLAIGFTTALSTIGLDLGALFAAGAVFAVALGFAMQNIVQNFVGGIILLVERSIKPGDVLEVEGTVVRIVRMGIRSTIARSRDGEDLLIPNATLIQGVVRNRTLGRPVFRVRAGVGVHYESDLAVTRKALQEVADALHDADTGEPALVLLLGFGSSSVDFEVAVWTRDPWQARVLSSEICFAIWDALKKAGIVIAYPQIDVHFDADAPPFRAAS